jgi:N6-adenosine-specific RNA methylase IME4
VATALHDETTAESASTIPIIPNGWQVILADPPWREEPFSWTTGSGRSVERHYGTMTIESMMDMGATVKQRAARDSMLFLWVTWPYLQKAFDVASAWGFRYSSNAWVWVKGEARERAPVIAPSGLAYPVGPTLDIRYGRGHTTRKGTELCLLFRRGAGVPRVSGGVGDVLLAWPEGRNSRKPDAQYKQIESFLGSGLRCIELFARPPHAAGWTVWGNEAA